VAAAASAELFVSGRASESQSSPSATRQARSYDRLAFTGRRPGRPLGAGRRGGAAVAASPVKASASADAVSLGWHGRF
jgi:hypothetical protein